MNKKEEHTMSILKVENLSYDYVTKAGLSTP